ncbi:chromate transporter [Aquirufa nivalisilvae]|uniref:chromate transporter n=1 Tax=Aquirufa nivalisilvae TaxID=2516557 RepID=UPI0022A9F0C7|nr:chromate transporter [Aquirufa nivalisilvae]MCZ2481672.1 chromate transporter [Aquirufa nivalisilvae]
MEEKAHYSLWQMSTYFLHLGTTGFGGPVALVEYMRRDLVESRHWISEEEFKQGLALAQLAPGPLAAQLAIYLGFVHYRYWGATLAGIAFVIPSFIMVVLLGMAYQAFGGLSWMQAIFYGVGAAVIGIIFLSSYKLTTKTIGSIDRTSLQKNTWLWLFFLVGALITYITQKEDILLFIGIGIFYMLLKAPPKGLNKQSNSFLLVSLFSFEYDAHVLWKMALFFFKAGAFVFGSGLAIVPFLQSGVVQENHWLTEQQFLDAVAVAMITPGPIVVTVGFIGYLVAGFPGAVVAALATFLPCYLFTILPAHHFKKIANNGSIKAFVDGITAAVVGALFGAVLVIAQRTLSDLLSLVIAVCSLIALVYIKKLKEPYLLLLAAMVGICIKLVF